MTGTSPFTIQPSSYHPPSYLPKLEANFMRDFSCCGITLPSLHDLLQHYEDAHAVNAAQSKPGPSKFLVPNTREKGKEVGLVEPVEEENDWNAAQSKPGPSQFLVPNTRERRNEVGMVETVGEENDWNTVFPPMDNIHFTEAFPGPSEHSYQVGIHEYSKEHPEGHLPSNSSPPSETVAGMDRRVEYNGAMTLTGSQGAGDSLRAESVISSTVYRDEYRFCRTHRTLEVEELPAFVQVRQLGHGSLGSVDEVRFPNSTRSVARKSIKMPKAYRDQYMQIVEHEVKALRSLSDCHIVKVIGTYEHGAYFVVLMSPVGERNLQDMLEEIHVHDYRELAWLLRWFFCLSSAVEYIHSKGIRHEDIKPSNIIHRGEHIYLTDFSSCTDFAVGMTTSTDTPAGRITRIYCAPEVLEDERHGLSADIFSLGCVFAEMTTVINQRRISDLYEHCSIMTQGSTRLKRLFYSDALQQIDEWLTGISLYELCIKAMLSKDRTLRPDAKSVTLLLAKVLDPLRCVCVRQ